MTGREKRPFAAILFGTTHDALAAEDTLKAAGFDVVPIPAPPSSEFLCGIAMRIVPDEVDRARSVLDGSGIEVRSVVEIEDV